MKRLLFTRGRRAVQPRRWLHVPVVLGAAVALAAGLGIGSAFAYFTSTGHGSGTATTGTSITMTVTAAAGTSDLLPGGTGAAYFTVKNTNSFAATFNMVAAGAMVVSQDTTDCPSSFISIAQPLPFTLSPAITVGANTTTTTQSIPDFVALSSSAPTGCQGVKFTVTLTLSGQST